MKNAQPRNRIPEGEQFSGLFVMGNFTSVCPPSVNQSCIQHHKIQRTEIQKNDSSRKKQSQVGDNVDRFQPISEKRFSVQSAMSDGKKQTQHRLKNWDNKPTFFSNATMTSSFRLRFDWTKLEPLSMLAIRMEQHQNNCSLPLGDFEFRNSAGLGSDLHFWGQAVCNGMMKGIRVRSIAPWVYYDQRACNATNEKPSPMTCYFPYTELLCPGDIAVANAHPTYNLSLVGAPLGLINPWPSYPYNGTLDVLSLRNHGSIGRVVRECDSIEAEFGRPALRAAATEFLFTRVSRVVQQEAERQLALVFNEAGAVPKDLITVHIRWGDKVQHEMTRVRISQYIQAVSEILAQRENRTGPVNIFLASEDPAAVKEFTQEAPKNWKIYLDQFYVEYLPHRRDKYSYFVKAAGQLKGRIGLLAIGSLLVSLEANDYVLTTASNWSRMINELRKSILNPRCNNCTKLIDLRKSRGNLEW